MFKAFPAWLRLSAACMAVFLSLLILSQWFPVKGQGQVHNDLLLNTGKLIAEGRNTFRFDTFGDEDFWGGSLQLHQAIEGSAFGGVGPGLSPLTALQLGLKVDVEALPGPSIEYP